MNTNLEYVSVAGYGSTGSSAVVNLLEEVTTCHVVREEFRFIQDPDGLEDLCSNIKKSWGWVRSDAFIRRFIKFTNILGRKPHYFEVGEDLDNLFDKNFFKYRDEFLENIIDSTWNGYWFYHDYHERNPLEIFIEKLKRFTKKFGVSKESIRKMTKKSNMYFVRHDVDIDKFAQIFINKLFKTLVKDKINNKIILDQLILPYNRTNFNSIFSNLKQIIVDRDPRDVYLDAMTYNAYPITKDINTFISFYESVHSKEEIINDSITLKIQFEDLIYNYEETINRIFVFLDIDKKDHENIKSRFDPAVSINNTQTWKKEKFSKYKSDIKIIENKLNKWCYKFD